MLHDIRCHSCGYRIVDHPLGINERLEQKCPKCRELMVKEPALTHTTYNKKGSTYK